MAPAKNKGNKDGGQESTGTRENHYDYDNERPYGLKKGIGFGAWGGFIGAVAFTGIMLVIPIILGLPTGTFLYAFGSAILPGSNHDQVTIGLMAFSLVLLQGIIVGIIFGAVTSRAKKLNLSKKGKGVGLGLIAGLITFIVVYVPIMLTVFPTWLSNTIATYPEMKLSLFGVPNYNNLSTTTLNNSYFPVTFGIGVIAYLVYGAIMGGIVTMSYSVFHFATNRGAAYVRDATQNSRTNTEAA